MLKCLLQCTQQFSKDFATTHIMKYISEKYEFLEHVSILLETLTLQKIKHRCDTVKKIYISQDRNKMLKYSSSKFWEYKNCRKIPTDIIPEGQKYIKRTYNDTVNLET